MAVNDFILLVILMIGACWINWEVIERDLFYKNRPSLPSDTSKKAACSSDNNAEILEENLS